MLEFTSFSTAPGFRRFASPSYRSSAARFAVENNFHLEAV